MELVKPSKGLWFHALITKNCQKAGVKKGQEEERVKPEMPITAKLLEEFKIFPGAKPTVDAKAAPHVSSTKDLMEVRDDLKCIRQLQEMMFQFAHYQYQWNNTFLELERRHRDNPDCAMNDFPQFPMLPSDFFAGIVGCSNIQLDASTIRNDVPPTTEADLEKAFADKDGDEDAESEEEELSTHLGDDKPLEGQFTLHSGGSSSGSGEDSDEDA